MLRFCPQTGCTSKVEKGYCPDHQPEARLHERRHYTGIPGVNYGRKWQREARLFLDHHPWCVLCPQGTKTLATEVDHKVPHKGDFTVFWDRFNWQPVCKPCHSAKTMREQRGTQ